LTKGGEEGFYDQCHYYYGTLINRSLVIDH
jgi:hypothetical protein